MSECGVGTPVSGRAGGQGERMSAAAKLLDRLEKVKSTGPAKYIACCPAHADQSPSLSIRDVDGAVLVHCFGGCQTSDVLAALGLEMADLYDDARIERGPTRSRIPARDVLEILSHEATVACLILADVIRDRRINEQDYERLALAASRIGGARDYTNR